MSVSAEAWSAERLERDLGRYLPVLAVCRRPEGELPWRYPFLVFIQDPGTWELVAGFEKLGRDWGRRIRVRWNHGTDGIYWVGISTWLVLAEDWKEGEGP